MFYKSLKFPKIKNRPFFYTNFVQTVDGKVSVKKEALPAGRQGYWPIGSRKDHEVLIELRSSADCLIHGGNLAREFGEKTLKSLKDDKFIKLRKKLGKTEVLPYLVITNNPQALPFKAGCIKLDNLLKYLKNKGYKNILVEGGPTLLGSFLKMNLINEIFLTISPKIYGTKAKTTLTLVEGILFSPKDYKKLKLVSSKIFEDEIFLRYRVRS